ncbi:MAG: GatB/YqeY domain-containing protein [Actinomycetota bacterium]|nr:GatB/YqeY domain-containing protein [Actinomycetota bacterium]
MALKEKLQTEMKEALKRGEKIRLSTIRMILSEIRYAEIEKRGELSEEELLGLLTREARKRKEAIAEFERGKRQDLVDKESEELRIIEGYLPEQMAENDIRALLESVIKEVDASSPSDLGKVMSSVMPKVKGKADGRLVNEIARELLSPKASQTDEG